MRMDRIWVPMACVLMLPLIVMGYVRVEQLKASDATPGNRLGYSVSVFNYTVVAGDYIDASVYVFSRYGDTWSQAAKLEAVVEEGDTSTGFPSAVSIYEYQVAVGARDATIGGVTSGGAVFLYTGEDAWSQQAVLLPNDRGPYEAFGYAVAVYDDRIAVGSYAAQSPLPGSNEGAVYLFTGSGNMWTQVSKLWASDGAQQECFACTVSLYHSTLVVGAYYSSKIYIFEYDDYDLSQWSQVATFNTSIPTDLGASVGVYNGTVAAGAPLEDLSPDLYDTGATYVFIRNGSSSWSLQSHLLAMDAAAGDQFGSSVGIYRDSLVVGAYADSSTTPGFDPGSLYIYSRSYSTWTCDEHVRAGDQSSDALLGFSVGVYNTTIVAGAPGDEKTGAAYIYYLSSTSDSPTLSPTAYRPNSNDGDDDMLTGENSNIYVGLLVTLCVVVMCAFFVCFLPFLPTHKNKAHDLEENLIDDEGQKLT